MKIRLLLLITLLSLWIVPVQGQGDVSTLLTRINALRSELGLPAYRVHPSLTAAAQQHANWMIEMSEVTHIQYDGSSPASRAAAAGYVSPWVSENIYMGGLASVDTAWNFWVNSSVHYAGLASTNFTHIGIATAQGEPGQAYVLVFGVDVSVQSSAASGNRGSGSAANNAGNSAAPPPSFVIGVDEVGNIMHELQAGQTLGDVLLSYGYTWDELPALMELNELTDADIRALEVGQVILVPPQAGTYTPTTDAEDSSEVTSEATEPAEVTAEIEIIEEAGGVLPTPLEPSPTDRIDAPVEGIIPTPAEASPIAGVSEPTLENGLLMPATFIAPQVTAMESLMATPTLTPTQSPQQSMRVSTVAVATEIATDVPIEMVSEVRTQSTSRPPVWLIGAIVMQVGILGFASLEFWRRNR